MAIKFTGKTETSYPLVPKGEYEVRLRVEKDKTKSTGSEYIKVTAIIRDDIKQNIDGQGGRLVFDGIYKNKETDIYNENKINRILSAIPNAKLDFDDYLAVENEKRLDLFMSLKKKYGDSIDEIN